MTLGEFFEKVARQFFNIEYTNGSVFSAAADVLETEGYVVLTREYYDTLIDAYEKEEQA